MFLQREVYVASVTYNCTSSCTSVNCKFRHIPISIDGSNSYCQLLQSNDKTEAGSYSIVWFDNLRCLSVCVKTLTHCYNLQLTCVAGIKVTMQPVSSHIYTSHVCRQTCDSNIVVTMQWPHLCPVKGLVVNMTCMHKIFIGRSQLWRRSMLHGHKYYYYTVITLPELQVWPHTCDV